MNNRKLIQRAFVSIFILLLLVGCSSAVGTPTATPIPIPPTSTYTPNPTNTPLPTVTIVPTVTVSPTPVPLEGKLFFDMNGSGLADKATFNFDPTRLTDERQPLQADLLAAINDYVQAHPDFKKGDLVTIEEPALSGFIVCAAYICSTTDKEGKFTISNPTSSALTLKITDPNAGTPALEMRYINKWNGSVVIPAYEMNGVQVPEQHLNDTTVMPLGDGVLITIGADNNIGLMQGFLSAPFPLGYPAYILGFFDINGRYPWDRNGLVTNYLGETYNWASGNPFASVNSDKINRATLIFPGVSGTEDGHDGLDIRMNLLTPVLAPIEGVVSDTLFQNGPDIRIKHTIGGTDYLTFYGHLDTRIIVEEGQRVYRNQIIAFSSNTGEGNNGIPALHFALIKPGLVTIGNYTGDTLIDPYRNVSGKDFPLGSKISSLTVDNFLIRSTIH